MEARSLEGAKRIQEACEEKDIRILTRDSPHYPSKARYPDSPILLFSQGQVPESYRGVAMVGSRRSSAYGRDLARETAFTLAREGDLIISGMAQGIDGQAHRGALQAGGPTLAFLAFGLDLCYPKEHRPLMEAIREKGALLSEYPPGTLPRPEYFPLRNRLISAFSDLVLVVEAGRESGALITARKALCQGKEVYVVPHDLSKRTGQGSNRLLLEEAKCFLGPWQISRGQEEEAVRVPKREVFLTAEEKAIL